MEKDTDTKPAEFDSGLLMFPWHLIKLVDGDLFIINRRASKRGYYMKPSHSTRGVFVQGRQILDAVLIANEIVDEKRRSGEEGVVFKIDFEKAYDHDAIESRGKKLLEGFRVGRNRTRVSHLQFANDTIFFSNPRKEELQTLKSFLLVKLLIARLSVDLYSIWVFLWEGIPRPVAFGIQ
ncbi:hypothetical protein CK203_058260 [Vitis vinifera]|uniref:Reverse transcriptase domain-containing protein n=1 Tax=Vitis vinifera TaxID=29760 RepID=A0A438FTR2_VITVI|nr:hypothetical protein CK203_058260 [Vitis vinifera]